MLAKLIAVGARKELLIVLFVCNFSAQANAGAFGETLRADYQSGKSVCGRMLTSPFRAHTSDLMLAGGGIAAVAIGSVWDSDVREKFSDLYSPASNHIANVGHAFQSTPVLAGTMGGFYVAGLLADRPKLRRCGLELMEAHLLAAAGTQLMKFTVGRDRPYMENGPSHFVGPNVHNGHQSFFSGDVTVAFVQAAVISAEANFVPLTIGLYGLAASTAFQRLYEDKHWLSDTMAAALWGSAVGLGVVHLNHHASDKVSINLSPTSIRFSCQL